MIKKVLIVDDEPNIVRLLSARLSAEGYEISTASDGAEALEKVESEAPHLMILDLSLPKVDGYEVCHILKTQARFSKFKDLPIVLLTASKEMKSISQGMGLGAVAYLQKPFQAEMLLGIIRGFVGSHE